MDMTPEAMKRLTDGMDDHFARVGYDKLPDAETAKKLTDDADRKSDDYDATDDPVSSRESALMNQAIRNRMGL